MGVVEAPTGAVSAGVVVPIRVVIAAVAPTEEDSPVAVIVALQAAARVVAPMEACAEGLRGVLAHRGHGLRIVIAVREMRRRAFIRSAAAKAGDRRARVPAPDR